MMAAANDLVILSYIDSESVVGMDMAMAFLGLLGWLLSWFEIIRKVLHP